VLSGPAPRPLDRYEVRVEGTRVWLKPPQAPEAAHS
jgi:Rieske Fe-S protein